MAGKKTTLLITLTFVGALAIAGTAGTLHLGAPLATTLEDFFQPGSQPTGAGGVDYGGFRPSTICARCHLDGEAGDLAIFGPWQGSMMAQSARDPLFYACLAIANQDAEFAGDLCIRCHTPGGWLSGRSEPTDGSALTSLDRDGVSCNVCHRMVDPIFKAGISPAQDENILANIDPLPLQPGGGNYVMDPEDFRRGPYADPTEPNHLWLHSPFHRSAAMCGTCHDVSNPAYQREPDGTYALTALDGAHPTGDKYDMFPLERTYSEWLESDFAEGGVDMNGRFGGNQQVVSTCQDCHMPKTEGQGCFYGDNRTDLAAHDFAGGNAWVQDMVLNLYPSDDVEPLYLHAGKDRAISMLQRACTLDLQQQGNHIRVRITNETGHKLPTGYPEGRRMWINVQVYDGDMQLLDERGAYNELTAELTTHDTKVYEAQLGLDETVADLTGLPEGKGFHFALNNRVFKDNRIPPRGFTLTGFRRVQAQPVGAFYQDGQYWDDTRFRVPPEAASVTVSVYYQTASREYITFLCDANVTDDSGDILYNQWELTGMSPPVEMAWTTLSLDPLPTGDFDGNQLVDLDDANAFIFCATAPGASLPDPACRPLDFDTDNDIDLFDFRELNLALTD